jgi:hypothetical protein
MWTPTEYQQAGGYVAATCTALLFMMWILTTAAMFGCFSWMKLRENGNKTPRASKVNDGCPEPLKVFFKALRKKWRPSFLFQYLSLVASLIAAMCQAVRKLKSFVGPYAFTMCLASSVGNLVGYSIAKMATCAFLGIKASLVFVVGNRNSSKGVLIAMVLTLAGVFGACFLGIAISMLIVDSFRVDPVGNCIIDAPPEINDALNAVDVSANVVLLLMFLIPVYQNHSMSKNSLTKGSKTSLRDTLINNLVMGVITTISAGISLGVLNIYQQYTSNGETLLVGALTIVDITLNCFVQFISTKKIWRFWFDPRETQFNKNPTKFLSGDEISRALLKLDSGTINNRPHSPTDSQYTASRPMSKTSLHLQQASRSSDSEDLESPDIEMTQIQPKAKSKEGEQEPTILDSTLKTTKEPAGQ